MGLRKWISSKELLPFFFIPVWLLGLSSYWKTGFRPLYYRIKTLWKHNGSEWLVQYLTEVTRALVCWSGDERYVPKGPSVSITGKGLPKVIPHVLRVHLIAFKLKGSLNGRIIFRAVLTVLSVYRVIGCYPKLKLGSITDPFTGISKTLPSYEVKEALARLGISNIKLSEPDLFTISESAGPNYAKATWGSPLDAAAYLRFPTSLVAFYKYCWHHGYTNVMLWHAGLLLVFLPLSPFLLIMGSFPRYLGRLVKLNEARGKVRVIAITDWWSQIILKPLHDSIFGDLRNLPMDGTFNQVAPLQRVLDLNRSFETVLYSFDLSAATDRLPIDLQVQVLNLLSFKGELWRSLLERPWYLDDKPIRYSVGQPMGAYSSWAMLALTHHVIVQIAAARSGVNSVFTNYAVLGDDIIIADQTVAQNYLAIMKVLGVDVNLTKSHQGRTAEFAKRWINSTMGDLSPIGAGNILTVVRNYKCLPSLIVEMREKGYPFAHHHVDRVVSLFPFLRRKVSGRVILMFQLLVLGPKGLSMPSNQSSGKYLESWLRLVIPWYTGDIAEIVYTSFRREYTRACADAYAKWHKELKYFRANWPRYSILETKNSFATFGIGKGDGVVGLLSDIYHWKGASVVSRLKFTVRYLLSALLIRVSPAYYAYENQTDPHDELWLKAQDLPWTFYPDDYAHLAQTLSEMMDTEKSVHSSILGWEERKLDVDFEQTQQKVIERVRWEYDAWHGSEPVSLILYEEPAVEETELTVDPSLAHLLDEGWEVV